MGVESLLTAIGMPSLIAGIAGPVVEGFGTKALEGLLGGGGGPGFKMPSAPPVQTVTSQVDAPGLGMSMNQGSMGGQFGIPGAGGQGIVGPSTAQINNSAPTQPFAASMGSSINNNPILDTLKAGLPGVSESMLKGMLSGAASGDRGAVSQMMDVASPFTEDKTSFLNNPFVAQDYLDELLKSMLGGGY